MIYMWRGLITCCLTLVALAAMLASLFCCYVTFATNDYTPILRSAAAFWVVGTLCWCLIMLLSDVSRWRVVIPVICWSFLVWHELIRRGFIIKWW